MDSSEIKLSEIMAGMVRERPRLYTSRIPAELCFECMGYPAGAVIEQMPSGPGRFIIRLGNRYLVSRVETEPTDWEGGEMIDDSSRSCAFEGGCGFERCPADCPHRMDIEPPREDIRDVWEYTRKMLLLHEWTEQQKSGVNAKLDEWRDSGRVVHEDVDGCTDLLMARITRRR